MREDGLLLAEGKPVAEQPTMHRPKTINKGTSGSMVTGLRPRLPSLTRRIWSKVKCSNSNIPSVPKWVGVISKKNILEVDSMTESHSSSQ